MKKSSISKIGLVSVAAVTGIWVLVGIQKPAVSWVDRDTGAEATISYTGDGESEISIGLRNGAEGTAVEVASFEALPSDWRERYPEAQLVETRTIQIGDGRFRRQMLLATRSDRFPWILWEDKIVASEEGDLNVVGTIVSMGNVFLVEADPRRVSESELELFMEENGLYVERRSLVTDYLCLGIDEPALGKLEELVAAYQACFPGAIAEFEILSFPSALPSDWDAARMWGLDKINAPDAWEFQTGDSQGEVVVAVIDTGLQRDHPDIASNLFVNPSPGKVSGLRNDVSGWDFFDNDNIPDDEDGHGTHVAGIVGAAGNNSLGAVGVNWRVKILPLKVGNQDGLRTSSITDALAYVYELKQTGINIVVTNNSYGSGGASVTTRNEIAKHEQEGILFVAAAGNDGFNMDANSDTLEYPVGYSQSIIIGVASSNQEDTLNGSSNYGRLSVDMAAPGSDIYSLDTGNSYTFLSGTSMASPMVAGAVALLANAEPTLTAAQIKERLMDTGALMESQSTLTVSGRRLDLLAALKPALMGHELLVTNVSDSIVIVDTLDTHPRFETMALENVTVTAEVVSGQGMVKPSGDGSFTFIPQAEGQAKVRFTSTLEGIARSIEKSVYVGSAADVSSGLVHHYDFSGNGTTVNDLAGGGNGTVTGATRSNGEFGTTLNFDDARENVTFSGKFSSRVTIAALVKSENLAASLHPRILNMPYYYLYFSSGSGAEVPDGNRQTLKFFSNYQNFGVWNAPPKSVKDGQWLYVVGSYDSRQASNTPKLYINGGEQIVRMQQEPIGSMVTTGGNSYLGNNETGDRAFAGQMADVRIYNRELNTSEVTQLGVALVQDKWRGFTLSGPDNVTFDAVAEYSLANSIGVDPGLTTDWHVESTLSSTIFSEDGNDVSVRFEDPGVYRMHAQVSDGLVTHVFSKEVTVDAEDLEPGYYSGETSGDGLVWLELDETLRGGFLTLLDVETGFYRIRESVTVDFDGNFETMEDAVGKVSGSILPGFNGSVLGYDVSFSGGLSTVTSSSESGFGGEFRGGALGERGDQIELRVLADGSAYVWRSGLSADLAIGTVSFQGELIATSIRGLNLNLVFDLDSDSVSGAWGESELFLTREGVEPDSELWAGFAGGYPSGEGVGGVYAEFVGAGELPSDNLQFGRFAMPSVAVSTKGPLVVLAANGRPVRLIDESPAGVSAKVNSGELVLEQREVFGIRVQVPLTAEGAGLVAFSIKGTEPKEILIRGLGPSFALTGVADPALSVYRLVEGRAVALSPNDNWRDGSLFTGLNESAQGPFRGLESAFAELGLPSLEVDAKDAAMRLWLAPGEYAVVLEAKPDDWGTGLIEVFGL